MNKKKLVSSLKSNIKKKLTLRKNTSKFKEDSKDSEQEESEENKNNNKKNRLKVSFANLNEEDNEDIGTVIENMNFEKEHEKPGEKETNINKNDMIKKATFFFKNNQNIRTKRLEMGKKFSKTSDSMKKVGTRLSKDIKAAKWFAVVLFWFCVCWLPLHATNCLLVLNGISCVDCLPFFVLLSHLNSAINPILYALGNSKFSSAFKRIIGLKSKSESSENEAVSSRETD